MNDNKSQIIINNSYYNFTLYGNTHDILFSKKIAKYNYIKYINNSKTNNITKKIHINNKVFYYRNLNLFLNFKEKEMEKYSNIIVLKNYIIFNVNYKIFFFILNDKEDFTTVIL